MTSIPLDAIPATDTTRRDQWGRYLVVPPGGGKPTGYTRVTTVAKALDDTGGLAPWKATMAAGGIIMRHGLRARWEALLASYGDPWYASELSKKLAKELVEECAAVGGGNDRKEIGSTMHTITALVDGGRTPQHMTKETAADVSAYVTGLAGAGISVVPGSIELVVVLDAWQVAGTFDRLAQVPGFDLPLVADLKTGSSLEKGWQPIAVQLAAYSRGEFLYQQGPDKNGSKDQRHPMPAVDQKWGLIMWLPAGEARLELYLIDLEAGWEAFEVSMWTRNWRQNAHPEKPYSMTLEQALEKSLEQVAAGEPSTEPQSLGPVEVTRTWLQDRINEIGKAPQARAALGKAWPEDMPTLHHSDAHTSDQLAVIERLLDDIEARYEIPFGPANPAVARVVDLFPGSEAEPQPKETA